MHKSTVPWINHSVWRQLVDRSHRNIGVALSRRWQLPAEVGEVVVEGRRLLGLSDAVMSLLCADLYSRVGTLFEIKVGSPKSKPS